MKKYYQVLGLEDSASLNSIRSNVAEIKKEYEARKSDDDTRMQTRDNLRKQFAEFDNLENESSCLLLRAH